MRVEYISIVMATYNRSDLLIKQLQAFQDQTMDSSKFEIIVVNDGSPDNTEEVLEFWASKLPNLKVIHQENSGPASARNRGVQDAKGQVIAFSDDDCIVDPDWIYEIWCEFNDSETMMVSGCTYTDRMKRTPLTHQIENKKWNPVIPTCNAVYRKDFFIKLGGFDTSFPHPHNEDTDLAWRALEVAELVYNERIRVYHPPILVPFKKQVARMKMLVSEFFLYEKNKESYKKWRSGNPWKTIYSQVFFYHQLLNLKYHLGFYKRPRLFIEGLMLSVSWWFYLIILFPEFLKQSRIQGRA